MTYHLPNGWTVETGRWLILRYARVSLHGVEAAKFWGFSESAVTERGYKAAEAQPEQIRPDCGRV